LNDEYRIWHENECEKILEQRHQIKVMTDSEYNKKSGKFYVYGNKRRVYFPKYPGNYFRYCTLLWTQKIFSVKVFNKFFIQ